MKIYKLQVKHWKTFNDKDKTNPGFRFGETLNEIKLAISKGLINNNDYFTEKRHSHVESYVYFIILSGKGLINVNDIDIQVEKNDVLEIAPKEIYFVKKATVKPFEWLVVGTITGNKDKVVYEN